MTGKFRRYFSLQNFVDFFKIPFGIYQAYKILKKFKPNVIFSKGGFVSIPVVYAAHYLKIPIVLHESDVSPGLANKLAAKKASILCLSHYESQKYFAPQLKKVVTGNPIREFVAHGDKERGFKITGFNSKLPIILIMGGSSGAQHINDELALAINHLAENYQIIHICGHGKIEKAVPISDKYHDRYNVFEYVDKELPDFYSITDLIVTRAGANSLAEIEALQIPAIIIPIGRSASRGDQIMNAFLYQELHPETKVIEDELLTYQSLIQAIEQKLPYENFIKKNREVVTSMASTEKVIDVLDSYLGGACIV